MREQAALSRRALAALPIAAFAGASRPAPATLPAPAGADDATLLDLGRRWQAALDAERAHHATFSNTMNVAEATAHEAVGDRRYADRAALFDRIMELRASTPAGLAVKARILAYENDVEHPDEDAVAAALASSRYLTDCAALSLVLDVLRLARAAS